VNHRKKLIDRRQFVTRSLAASTIAALPYGFAQAEPCPPILAGASGGSGSGNCALEAEADWLLRSTGPGVQWAHNFASDDEVKFWIWVNGIGDDPERVSTRAQQVTRDTGDGVTGGGCLRITRPTGTEEIGHWWRPMSAMQESGRGVPDIGWSSGMPTIDPPVFDSGRLASWNEGNYGPSSTGNWDGGEFYLQLRMKLDPVRRDTNNAGGKILYFTRTQRSLTAQEIVTTYRGASPHLFRLYKAGSPGIESDFPLVEHFYDQWATYLYHIIPGDENQPNTTIEVWRALPGETDYTKIYQVLDERIDYSDAYLKAWNAILFSTYHNGFNMPEFWQKYDEIIFSNQHIPPPAMS